MVAFVGNAFLCISAAWAAKYVVVVDALCPQVLVLNPSRIGGYNGSNEKAQSADIQPSDSQQS
ncbi:MAG: hypothetical protein DMG14_07150 [Acidobacteria bacterium]|nr:MAG: hypothetical protein DMG14_07150 [Acidobacteriota bacterium]